MKQAISEAAESAVSAAFKASSVLYQILSTTAGKEAIGCMPGALVGRVHISTPHVFDIRDLSGLLTRHCSESPCVEASPSLSSLEVCGRLRAGQLAQCSVLLHVGWMSRSHALQCAMIPATRNLLGDPDKRLLALA